MNWQVPTVPHVLEARRRMSPHLRPTPLFGYGTLNELLGADIFVKHEIEEELERGDPLLALGHQWRLNQAERASEAINLWSRSRLSVQPPS